MAALDFPDSPATGDLYGSSGTVWRWDGARWASTAGASGARGVVGYAQITANITGVTGSQVDVAKVTVPVVAGRRYRVTGELLAFTSVANDMGGISLADGSGNGLQTANFPLSTVSNAHVGYLSVVYGATATAAVMFQFRYQRSVGTGTHTVVAGPAYPAFVLVEDITYEAGTSGVGIEPTAYVPVTLTGGFTNRGTSVAGYRKVGDEVVMRGLIDTPVAAQGTVIATLPVGFRPPTWTVAIPVNNQSGNTSQPNEFLIRTTGTVEVLNAVTNVGYMGLEIVRFSVTP